MDSPPVDGGSGECEHEFETKCNAESTPGSFLLSCHCWSCCLHVLIMCRSQQKKAARARWATLRASKHDHDKPVKKCVAVIENAGASQFGGSWTETPGASPRTDHTSVSSHSHPSAPTARIKKHIIIITIITTIIIMLCFPCCSFTHF